MRVGIAALLHESNTFVREPTGIERFEEDLLLCGEPILDVMGESHHEVGGFIEGLERAGIEPVPVFVARACPSGTITSAAFHRLITMLLSGLDRAGHLDGLLVAPHGATVSEVHRDADGFWLAAVRQRLGPATPIVGTLDPHANLSPRMVESCDALIAYRTNPHLDQRQRGLDAAELISCALAGDVRPVQAAAFPPLAIPIEHQETSAPPCRPFCERVAALGEEGDVLSASVVLGFPYADVREMGSSVLVVADGQRSRAVRLAGELADELWSRRRDFVPRRTTVDEALERAATLTGPVCLLDMGDNVGGGSPGDGTVLAHALCKRSVGASFVCLCDAESAAEAARAGAGARRRLRVGARSDLRHGEPLEAEFTVLGIHAGKFEEPEPRHGAFRHMDQGLTAVVRTDSRLTVMLTSRRVPPFSLRQMTAFGLEPAGFRYIVAKGVHAPLAAYREVCRHFVRVDTPGVTTADLTALDYQRRRRPLFPFEEDTTWSSGAGT